jgi:hypothetical protein
MRVDGQRGYASCHSSGSTWGGGASVPALARGDVDGRLTWRVVWKQVPTYGGEARPPARGAQALSLVCFPMVLLGKVSVTC